MSNIKNPIHGVKKKSLLDKKWLVEALGFFPAVLTVGFASAKYFNENHPLWGLSLAFVCLWTILFSIVKIIQAKRQDEKDDDLRSHDGLIAALTVVHELAASAGNLSGADKMKFLRATFHRVMPPLGDSDKIEQIVNYVGGGGDGVGREFPIRSGITGAAIREDEVYLMERESENFDDYKKELIKQWHYTDKDAKTATSDRFSAIAIPVKSRDGQTVLGVVYLDCNQRKFFSSPQVAEAVVNGCAGITRYIGERYV